MSDSATPWTVARQAPPSMEFPRQECRSGLPFPSPGNLPDAGIEPVSPALRADALPSEPQGLFYGMIFYIKNKKQGFPGASVVKNPPADAGDTGLIPGPGRSRVPGSSTARAPQVRSLGSRARQLQPKPGHPRAGAPPEQPPH